MPGRRPQPRVKFRQAEASDDLFIESLLWEFYQKQGHCYGVPYNPRSTTQLISDLRTDGILLVGPSSCAGATLHPFLYNRDVQIAYVVFWYFRSPREIRILEALESCCRAAGAFRITVASHPPDHVIGRRYEGLGYSVAESQWSKPL